MNNICKAHKSWGAPFQDKPNCPLSPWYSLTCQAGHASEGALELPLAFTLVTLVIAFLS